MKDICIITGGGSGMGLASAKILGKDQYVILVGRTPAKLEGALSELKDQGIEAEVAPGDVSNRESMEKLAAHAAELGTVKTVVHAAGMSPHMGTAEAIFKTNTIGTINVNEAFAPFMSSGACIIDFSSMSTYMLPEEQLPTQIYPLSLTDPEAFLSSALEIFAQLDDASKAGMAYILSKHFVIWHARAMAVRLGKEGIRVISISPGTFETPMGELEGEAAAEFAVNGALGRLGDPSEMGELVAFLSSPKASYITGVDILCDGGSIAAMKASA